MPDVPLSALDARQQKLVENARIALERGNADYVIAACEPLLQSAPACMAVRRLWWRAQRLKHHARGPLLASIMAGLARVRLAWGGGPRSATERFARMERLLQADPTLVAALKVQAAAAGELGWDETAVFLRETARELAPADRENLLALGEAWLVIGRPDDALHLAEEMLQSRPADHAALQLLRKASVARTVAGGTCAGGLARPTDGAGVRDAGARP